MRISVLAIVCVPPLALLIVLRAGSAPRFLRWYLQTSGGLFVKLGQLLALRYDLIPANYCGELATLLDALPPVRTAVIQRAIEVDLGKQLDELFVRFDPEPLSCASIAQVHGAKLPSGESVVVKVVRPGSELRFRADTLFVRVFARALELLGIGKRLGLARLAGELAASTAEEFDLGRELRNAELLGSKMRGDGLAHRVPRTFRAVSCRSVLTMERIEGVTVSRVIAALVARDTEQLAAWSLQGIDPSALAILLLRSMLMQMFRHRTFHADPHSSNLLVCPGGELVYVDFGIFGWLDERQRALQLRMRQALGADNIHAAYRAMAKDFRFQPGSDPVGFEGDVKEILWSWSQSASSPYASLQEKSAGELFLKVLEAARRWRVAVPAGMMRLYRALIVSDMVILKLDPRLDILGEVRKFQKEETARETLRITARTAAGAPAAAARFVADAPEIVSDVLDWLDREADGPRATRTADPRPNGRVVRVLLSQGAWLTGVFTLLALARQLVTRIPGFDDLTAALGIDVAGRPGLAIGGAFVCFLLFKRAATALDD